MVDTRQAGSFDRVDGAVQLNDRLFEEKLVEAQNAVAVTPLGNIGGDTGVSDIVLDSVREASRLGHEVGAMKEGFAQGVFDDLHGTFIAAKKAEISVKLVGTVRNKLLDAFQELWRIRV